MGDRFRALVRYAWLAWLLFSYPDRRNPGLYLSRLAIWLYRLLSGLFGVLVIAAKNIRPALLWQPYPKEMAVCRHKDMIAHALRRQPISSWPTSEARAEELKKLAKRCKSMSGHQLNGLYPEIDPRDIESRSVVIEAIRAGRVVPPRRIQ